MLTEASVVRAARSAGIQSPVAFKEVTGSTNSDLLSLAEEGAPAWTIVAAGHQEEGRGRLGRAWQSSPGASLLVSVLLRPDVAAPEAALLTLAAGACMATSCAVVGGVDVRCKWPNDLYVGERKVGGVLTESKVQGDRVAHAVVGVGVNLTQGPEDFDPALRDSATSLAMAGGRPDAGGLLFEFLLRMKRFADPQSPAYRETVLDMYRRVCETIGRTVRAATTSGDEVTGTATGIGSSGQLLIDTSAGPREVLFGEVAHLD